MSQYEIITGDAFKALAKMREQSADLILSSPPYFMGKEYDRSTDLNDFISDHERLVPLLLRVLKPGGSLCWQVGNHVRNGELTPLDALVFSAFRSPDLKLRNRIIWSFGHGTHSTRRFSGRHESVLWFTKGDEYFFDLDAVRVPQKYPGKRHYKGPNKGSLSGHPLGKNPADVWEIPNVNARHIEKSAHPCQFPVALAQRIVRALCPIGGTVLDPFSGVASAGVAAIIEGRSYVGIELHKPYVAISRERLRKALEGTLAVRPIEKPIYVPGRNELVAQLPDEFAAVRGGPNGQKAHQSDQPKAR